MNHKNTYVELRRHPGINECLHFKLKAEDFDVITETIDLNCIGAYCQVNRHISLMTNLKIVLALPYGDQGNEFDYIKCSGVVVRVERALSVGNVSSVYNIAVYFNEIGDSEREKMENFFEGHPRREIGIAEKFDRYGQPDYS